MTIAVSLWSLSHNLGAWQSADVVATKMVVYPRLCYCHLQSSQLDSDEQGQCGSYQEVVNHDHMSHLMTVAEKIVKLGCGHNVDRIKCCLIAALNVASFNDRIA